MKERSESIKSRKDSNLVAIYHQPYAVYKGKTNTDLCVCTDVSFQINSHHHTNMIKDLMILLKET